VTDFHSAEAATKAGEDWAKQFQKGEVPDDVELVEVVADNVRLGNVIPDEEKRGGGALRDVSEFADDSFPVRIDKLIRQAGLASSNTEAAARIKSGAVSIAEQSIGPDEVLVNMPLSQEVVLRVGRRIKRVRIIDPSGGKWQ
jgi:tyrosyl-tRNA synthetase